MKVLIIIGNIKYWDQSVRTCGKTVWRVDRGDKSCIWQIHLGCKFLILVIPQFLLESVITQSEKALEPDHGHKLAKKKKKRAYLSLNVQNLIYFVVAYQFSTEFTLSSTVLTCCSGKTAAGFPLKGTLVKESTVNTGISMLVRVWVCRKSDCECVVTVAQGSVSKLWTCLFQLFCDVISPQVLFYKVDKGDFQSKPSKK